MSWHDTPWLIDCDWLIDWWMDSLLLVVTLNSTFNPSMESINTIPWFIQFNQIDLNESWYWSNDFIDGLNVMLFASPVHVCVWQSNWIVNWNQYKLEVETKQTGLIWSDLIWSELSTRTYTCNLLLLPCMHVYRKDQIPLEFKSICWLIWIKVELIFTAAFKKRRTTSHFCTWFLQMIMIWYPGAYALHYTTVLYSSCIFTRIG